MWHVEGVSFQQLHATQHPLRRVKQIPSLVEAIQNGEPINPVRIAFDEERQLFWVDNGHHRCVAYWLTGVQFIPWEAIELRYWKVLPGNRCTPFVKFAERHAARLRAVTP